MFPALFFCSLLTVTCNAPETIREVKVTAYNVGVEAQNDSSPCISANNENICEAVENGEMVGAMNGVPFGTIVQTPWGGVRIIDRKNRRYGSDWLDVAMPKDKVKEARQFGVKKIRVVIY